MKYYGITTPATEDKPAMTCFYPYAQWKQIIESFKEAGIEFKAFTVNECVNDHKRAERKTAMKHITFEYKDEYTKGEWRKQECVVSSVQECKELYGLGIDCEYRILKVEEV